MQQLVPLAAPCVSMLMVRVVVSTMVAAPCCPLPATALSGAVVLESWHTPAPTTHGCDGRVSVFVCRHL